MVTKDTQRSLNDRHREIEKFVEEAHFSLQNKMKEKDTVSKITPII